MKTLKRIRQKLGYDGLLLLVIVFLVGFSWSWLFQSRVTALSNSIVVGYFIALLAFVVFVSFSSYVYYKFIRFFNHKFLAKSNPSPWVLPLLFVLWAGVEFLVVFLSAFVWMGKNGSIDSVLPFAAFTPFVSHTPLVFLVRFLGFHGLSATIVVLLYVGLVEKLRKYIIPTVSVVFVLTVTSWVLYKTPSGTMINAVIVAEKLTEKTDQIDSNHDIIVFPEYGFTGSSSGADRLKISNNKNTYYVGSKQTSAGVGHNNILVFGSAKNGDIEQRNKSRLIPGGEYLPYFVDVILNITGAQNTKEYFQILNSVEKGPTNHQPLGADNRFFLGSSVCSSIIQTEDYRKFVQNGATILTNSASLGIFASKLFTTQHRGLAKFMAVSNARPFLQSSNDSDAFALDHNGRTIATIQPINSREVKISTNTKRTPYSYLGEWPAFAGVVTIVILILKKYKIREKLTKKPSK